MRRQDTETMSPNSVGRISSTRLTMQIAYLKWKVISAQAGKNLLKLTQSKEPDPLPQFDNSDLDF